LSYVASPLRLQPTFSKAGVLATGVGTHRWYNDSGRTLTIKKIRASAGAAPSGASILVDVNINAGTIFSTQTNRLTIASGGATATQTVFNTTTITDGSYFTIDIDQVGSTTPGSDLVVTIWLEG
jgi:hypothetical protein